MIIGWVNFVPPLWQWLRENFKRIYTRFTFRLPFISFFCYLKRKYLPQHQEKKNREKIPVTRFTTNPCADAYYAITIRAWNSTVFLYLLVSQKENLCKHAASMLFDEVDILSEKMPCNRRDFQNELIKILNTKRFLKHIYKSEDVSAPQFSLS